MASPRKMATRENGKLAKEQRDCPKLLGKVGPFLANFIFNFTIFRVLTKSYCYLLFNYFLSILSYLCTKDTGLGVYCGDESYLNRKTNFGKIIDFFFYYYLNS